MFNNYIKQQVDSFTVFVIPEFVTLFNLFDEAGFITTKS